MGDMADLYEYLMFDDDYEYCRHNEVKCRYCGERNVKWKKLNKKWRMVTLHKEQLHLCKKYIIKAVKGEIK